MKKRYFLSVLFLYASVNACIDMRDEHSSGVFFNNNEVFFLDRFDSLGKAGTNFIRDCMMIKPDPSTKDVIILTPTKDPLDWHDMFSILNVSITTNLMAIKVEYGGGCETHQFAFYVDSILTGSNNPVLNFTLIHNANGDACKALITETLVFNLRPIETFCFGSAPLKVILNNTNTGLSWYRDNTCSIKYRSHYSSDAMVVLEYSPVENFSSQVFPGMRIVTDPDVKYANGFNYKDAVVTELLWLIKHNIISALSEQTISHIKNSIERQGQFWTFQDTLLPYNAFFSLKKDSSGELKWGDVIYTQRKSCSSEMEFELPEDSLSSSTTPVKFRSGNLVNNNFALRVVNNKIAINFNRKTTSPAQINIIDLNGRLLHTTVVPANQSSFTIQAPGILVRGIYQAVFKTKGVAQTRTMIVSE